MPVYKYIKQNNDEIKNGRDYIRFIDSSETNPTKGFFGNTKKTVGAFFMSTPASGVFSQLFSPSSPEVIIDKEEIIDKAGDEKFKADAYIYLKNIEWAIEQLNKELVATDKVNVTEPKNIKELLEKVDPDIFKESNFSIDVEQPNPENPDNEKEKAKKLLAAYLVNFHEDELRVLLGRPKKVSSPPPPPPPPPGVSLHAADAVPPKPKSKAEYSKSWNEKLDQINSGLKAKFELDFKGEDTTKGFSVKYKNVAAGKESEIIKFDAAGGATLNQKACEENGLTPAQQVDILIASYTALHTDKTKKIIITHDNDVVSQNLVRALETKLKGSGYSSIEIKVRTPAAAPSGPAREASGDEPAPAAASPTPH